MDDDRSHEIRMAAGQAVMSIIELVDADLADTLLAIQPLVQHLLDQLEQRGMPIGQRRQFLIGMALAAVGDE